MPFPDLYPASGMFNASAVIHFCCSGPKGTFELSHCFSSSYAVWYREWQHDTRTQELAKEHARRQKSLCDIRQHTLFFGLQGADGGFIVTFPARRGRSHFPVYRLSASVYLSVYQPASLSVTIRDVLTFGTRL